jgi:hypothetical protein
MAQNVATPAGVESRTSERACLNECADGVNEAIVRLVEPTERSDNSKHMYVRLTERVYCGEQGTSGPSGF